VRFLAIILLLASFSAHAALEEWSCLGLSDYYGFVAIDRDRGMPVAERVNTTVNAIITVMDSKVAHMNVEADDAQALIQIVHYVYSVKDHPVAIKKAALNRCIRGNPLPPAFKPTGLGV